MKNKLITLWQSAKRASQLRALAAVHSTVVLDLKENRTILYTQAGAKPAFDDAKQVYMGERANLALVLVGDVTPWGDVTLAGTPLTDEQKHRVDVVREQNIRRGYDGRVERAPLLAPLPKRVDRTLWGVGYRY